MKSNRSRPSFRRDIRSIYVAAGIVASGLAGIVASGLIGSNVTFNIYNNVNFDASPLLIVLAAAAFYIGRRFRR